MGSTTLKGCQNLDSPLGAGGGFHGSRLLRTLQRQAARPPAQTTRSSTLPPPLPRTSLRTLRGSRLCGGLRVPRPSARSARGPAPRVRTRRLRGAPAAAQDRARRKQERAGGSPPDSDYRQHHERAPADGLMSPDSTHARTAKPNSWDPQVAQLGAPQPAAPVYESSAGGT